MLYLLADTIPWFHLPMRQPLIATNSSLWQKSIGFLLLMFVVPIAIVVKLMTLPFERPTKRSPTEVAKYLRDFLNGTGGDWDWDDFISIEIADPRLEAIRQQAAALELPMADEDTGSLRELICEAEALVDC